MARTYLGLLDLDAAGVDQLQKVLAISALEAAHPDDLAGTARMWLYERRIVIPGPRRLADLAREAFDATEAAMAATIEAGVGKAALLKAIDWCYATQSGGVGTRLEWLKTPPKRHSPSTMAETLEKIRALKELGVHVWPLDAVALSKQQAYAAHVQMRRPSMTARIERQRQTVEITCFLRVTLLELTDMALLQASRRSQDLLRRAAERVEKGRSRSGGATLQRAIHGGQVAPERGRRRQEMAAISGAHALLTNIVLAWNTNRMDTVVTKLNRDGVGIEEDWLRRIGPAHFSHINFRGTFRFNVERYADVLVERAAGRGVTRSGQ